MTTLAVPADVSVRVMRDLSTAETAFVTAVISELSSEIRLRLPGIDARVAASTDYAAVVRGRIAAAVAGFLSTRSDGAIEETVGGMSRRWETARSSGFAGFTADDWAAIIPVSGLSGAYVIPLGG